MEKDIRNRPLAESSVSHKLSKIQERCTRLLQESEWLDDLALEGDAPVEAPDRNDPYNRG
ncbi:MAG: hypothetical protein ACR2QX_00960 [Woeseiaceae bacterium]